jgi:hypothetical protein
MSAEPIYLVVDSGSPVTEFTDKDALKAYLKRTATRSRAAGLQNQGRTRASDHDRVAGAGRRARRRIKASSLVTLRSFHLQAGRHTLRRRGDARHT